MLSRTAANLYWIGRYLERADFLARILDATLRMTALPDSYGGASGTEWASAIATVGAAESFVEHRGDPSAAPDEASVANWVAFDPANPSSIVSCIDVARTNARDVRTALTTELWEIINGAWNDLRRFQTGPRDRESLGRFIDWTKAVCLSSDGAIHRTMLRNDAYWFLQLGSAIERADNTARILDVKYHLLLPESEHVGGSIDYFQWSTILRGVSALTAYRWCYRDTIRPWLVADLLILNPSMPRSLACCYAVASQTLEAMSEAHGHRGPGQRHAATVLAQLRSRRIEDIFQSGLHEFVQDFLIDNNQLGSLIAEQYLL